jgi:hypothetical protein
MSQGFRLVCYFAATVLIAVVSIYFEIQRSLALVSDDPSACAWFGFLPFIFPVFLAHGAVIVVPAALIIEAVLLIRRVIKQRK